MACSWAPSPSTWQVPSSSPGPGRRAACAFFSTLPSFLLFFCTFPTKPMKVLGLLYTTGWVYFNGQGSLVWRTSALAQVRFCQRQTDSLWFPAIQWLQVAYNEIIQICSVAPLPVVDQVSKTISIQVSNQKIHYCKWIIIQVEVYFFKVEIYFKNNPVGAVAEGEGWIYSRPRLKVAKIDRKKGILWQTPTIFVKNLFKQMCDFCTLQPMCKAWSVPQMTLVEYPFPAECMIALNSPFIGSLRTLFQPKTPNSIPGSLHISYGKHSKNEMIFVPLEGRWNWMTVVNLGRKTLLVDGRHLGVST